MHTSIRSLGLVAAIAAAACEGDPGPAGPPGGIDPALAPADKLILAMGGDAALVGLDRLSATVTGSRYVLDEGYLPGEPAVAAGTFTAELRWDLAADQLRLDYQRTPTFPFPGAYQYTEYLGVAGGWREGVDNLFGAPGGAMPSDRWASGRRQQRLLHPEVLVRGLATGALAARDAGLGVVGGVLHHRLEVDDPVHPWTFWVEVGTGRLTRVVTIENEHLRGDVELTASYAGWEDAGGGLRLPRQAVLTVDGEVIHEEQRTALSVNPSLAADTFAIPGGGAVAVDAADAARGERTHSFHQMFAAVGIPLDGLQTQVQASELRPGVWHLTGGSHHSLVVEQASRVIVVEAPLYPARAEAVRAWIASRFPGKPVSHVIATHAHGDHAGGLRAFVAAGATVVAGSEALGLYRQIFAAPRTIEPDALAGAPRPATLVGVAPGRSLTLADAQRPVEIYPVDTTHAADMLVAVAGGVLFVSDIYSPGLPPSPQAIRELRQAITDHPGIPVALLAGGHGGTATLAELDAAIAASGS